jgi:preprotein translocase subunit SecD
MLDIPRWKAFAILLTTAVVCLMAVPNLLSVSAVENWPKWAQRKFELGYDLQGGTRIVLAVDREALHRQIMGELRDTVRKALRDARIGHSGVQTRDEALEVRIRDPWHQEKALAKLREHAPEAIVETHGQLFRLRLAGSYFDDRVRSGRRSSIDNFIRPRIKSLGAQSSIQSRGSDLV